MEKAGYKMLNIRDLKIFLRTHRNVVVTTHHKPDADALGSALGLANYLLKKGHHVIVISPTDYPKFLEWMEGNNKVIVYEENLRPVIEKKN